MESNKETGLVWMPQEVFFFLMWPLLEGVASNSSLRAALENVCARHGATLHVPHPSLCVDNGVMIAWAAHEVLAAADDEDDDDWRSVIERAHASGKTRLGEVVTEVGNREGGSSSKRLVFDPRWPIGGRLPGSLWE